MKRYYKRNLGRLALYGLSCLLLAASTVIMALLLGAIAEAAMAGDFARVWPLSAGALLYILFDVSADFLWRCSRDAAIQRIGHDLRSDLAARTARLTWAEKSSADDGQYISMAVNDVQTIEDEYLEPLANIIFQVCYFVFTVSSALVIQPVMTLIMVAVAVPTALFPRLTEGSLQRSKEAHQAARAEHLSVLSQLLGGFFLLRVFDGFAGMGRRYDGANDALCEKAVRFKRAKGLVISGAYGMGSLVALGSWAVGGLFVVAGALTLPLLITFNTLMGGVAAPVQIIGEHYANVTAASAVKKRLLAFLDAPGSEDSRWGSAPLAGVERVELRGLTCSAGDRALLKNVDLTLRRGDRVALLGESGSGKSTLLKALAAMGECEGSYTLNGLPFRDYSAAAFRRNVTLLEQKTFLFDASIRDDLTLFDPSPAPDEELKALLERVGLGRWLESRGGSLDTPIGRDSQALSGGEERRLDLARTLYRGASLVLMDEPTTGLDPETRGAVEAAIADMDCDILVVAMHEYSPRFLSRFDRVLRLENGALREA